MRELRAAGRSVLLSSHILSEVEALCDRVTIIRAGRAAETGTFEELRHLTRTSVVVDTVKPLASVTGWSGVHDVRVQGGHAEFSVEPSELNQVLEHLVDLQVRSMSTSPPTLEELFMRHYGDDVSVPAGRSDADVVAAR